MNQLDMFNNFEPCIEERLARLSNIKKGSVIFATIAYKRICKYLLREQEDLWHKYVFENWEENIVANSLSKYIANLYEIPVQAIHNTETNLYYRELDRVFRS